jgi:hypothetical protein
MPAITILISISSLHGSKAHFSRRLPFLLLSLLAQGILLKVGAHS